MGIRNKWILIALTVLLALGLCGRWWAASHVFEKRHNPSEFLYLDEIVYLTLGQNLIRGQAYSTQKQYEKLLHLYDKVPRYLNDPLFKHPPLYPAILGASVAVFGPHAWAAFLPNLALSIVLTWLVFALTRAVFHDDFAGLIAAALFAVSPTAWFCAGRIVMEIPMTCAVAAAVLFQIESARCPRLLWTAAIAWAAAWWTKYPAIPMWALVQAALLMFRPALLKRKDYWAAQALTLVLFLPWIAWRWNVDGVRLFSPSKSPTEEWQAFAHLLSRPLFWAGGVMALAAAALFWNQRRVVTAHLVRWSPRWASGAALAIGSLALLWFFWLIWPELLSFSQLPWHGDLPNRLADGPWFTYLVRQAAFEPATLVGFTLIWFLPGGRAAQALKVIALLGTVLVIAWGNYQMRYFLLVLPFWHALTAGALMGVFRRIPARPWGAAWLAAWLGFSLARSVWLDARMVIPSDFFYF
ncbi:MAG: glycosyltransferase family 39 protein [Verrucomicrobiae bacterium]|nr:glycosyltransferase family 39 protein [Verrucomicrobiae bacterium]